MTPGITNLVRLAAWAVALALGVLSGWMASALRRATRDWPGSSA